MKQFSFATLVARLADYVEFDRALWNPKSLPRLNAQQLDAGEAVADSLFARVAKAAKAHGIGDEQLSNELPWAQAEHEVAKRQGQRAAVLQARIARKAELARERELLGLA